MAIQWKYNIQATLVIVKEDHPSTALEATEQVGSVLQISESNYPILIPREPSPCRPSWEAS